MSENGFHIGAHAGASTLLDVFSSFYKTDPAHHMVPVFDPEDLPDLFWYGDSSACYDFSEERNVFLIDLYWQYDRVDSGSVGE